MWSISAIAEDWVDKGCHIHIGRSYIELSVRPNHLGQVVFRKVFSSTRDTDFDVASRVALDLLRYDSDFRVKLRDSIVRAMVFLLGITGQKSRKARGRLRELNFLLIALDRLEAS